MKREKIALKKFQKLVNDAYARGETGLIIWKSSAERDKWGSEEKICVKNAFEVHGFDKEGIAYGTYRNMELSRAIRNAFSCNYQFKLPTDDGKSIAAMVFEINKLLSNNGYFMFACRGMLYKHLNGPIVSIPTYQVIEENSSTIVNY